jgi:hypothetical protein
VSQGKELSRKGETGSHAGHGLTADVAAPSVAVHLNFPDRAALPTAPDHHGRAERCLDSRGRAHDARGTGVVTALKHVIGASYQFLGSRHEATPFGC